MQSILRDHDTPSDDSLASSVPGQWFTLREAGLGSHPSPRAYKPLLPLDFYNVMRGHQALTLLWEGSPLTFLHSCV